MDSPIPSDPYEALGVPKDCDASVVKSTYRKLVLKCHPDKVTDESLKAQKAEEFHKIQQAYEILSDEQKRSKYDAQVRLAELKKEALERKNAGKSSGARPSGPYEVRTAAPAGSRVPTSGSTRAYDDMDKYSKKYDFYDSRHSSPRIPRERESPSIRVSVKDSDRSRSDKKKMRDRDEKRERSEKYYEVYGVDDREYFREQRDREREREREKERQRERAREEERRVEEQRAKRQAEESRRRPEEREAARRSDEYLDRSQKEKAQYNAAQEYIQRAENVRPSPQRKDSSQETYGYEYRTRRATTQPAEVRRSSARPKDRSNEERPRNSSQSPREPEIVEFSRNERRVPAFEKSTSSPANIKVTARPLASRLERSHTTPTDYDHHTDHPSHPSFRRSETTPALHTPSSSSSSRKKESVPTASKLRHETTNETSHSSPAAPEVSTKYYRYSSEKEGGVRLHPADDHKYSSGSHRTVLHEPERIRNRSPSPLRPEFRNDARPPLTSSRTVPVSSGVRYTTAVPGPTRSSTFAYATPDKPSATRMSSSASRTPDARESGREDKKYFMEISREEYERIQQERAQRSSYRTDEVKRGPKYTPNDVNYTSRSSRGREDYCDVRPGLQRGPTYVY